MLGWTPSTSDAHNPLYTLLSTRDGKRGEVNNGGYSNPELDALVDKIAVETDQAKRNAMIDQSIGILQKEIPTIPLHQQVIVWASSKKVEVAQTADNLFQFRFIRMK
jgi:peptide/nickel transport system substrate-binding protein